MLCELKIKMFKNKRNFRNFNFKLILAYCMQNCASVIFDWYVAFCELIAIKM